ncbi:MAG: hypothetical protein Kow0068_11870 [Marinilabiliales bacterium]
MSIKYKILIADDEPAHIENLYHLLKDENFEIISAKDGRTAFELAEKFLPDTILLDWDMPVLDGLEATLLLRNNETTRNIPIILATGKMLSRSHLEKAFDAGVNDFITKPFNNFEIIARVKSMIKYYNNVKKTISIEKEISELKINSVTAELATAKLKLIRLNSFIDNINTHLFILNKFTNNKGAKIISKIQKEIFSNEKSTYWDEFEEVIKKFNASFITNLNNIRPRLTSNEKKLCIFIKMNLTIKEIALITMSNPEAINKAKYRLKKKLSIGEDETLNDFINKL